VIGARSMRFRQAMFLATALYGVLAPVRAQQSGYAGVRDSLLVNGLRSTGAYTLLAELVAKAPHRLSGSAGAAMAVETTREMMERLGFQQVHRETCMVPHWERGPVERAEVLLSQGGKPVSLTVCALGGSVATPSRGVTAEVVEVRSFAELKALGNAARGKIVFFNRPFDQGKLNTFEGYSVTVDQRSAGAIEAAKAGAVASLIRSVTSAIDDVPHTGSMGYQDSVAKIPGAAVSTLGADKLSGLLKRDPRLKLRLTLSCKTYPDALSANVCGEITGSERPGEVIVVGGHLDAWDKGEGAHDDASGCVQAIEAVRLLKSLGLRPKRTIRAVMFMNEENGLRGGKAYAVAPQRNGETHIAAIESDRGGFTPRGFDVQADSAVLTYVRRWKELFETIEAGRIRKGGSGVDISPLVQNGVPGFGLVVDSHRYFDYHHSGNDTVGAVNPRELEMGAVALALFSYLIAEEGLPPGAR
jgi:carboxypeptidase Q